MQMLTYNWIPTIMAEMQKLKIIVKKLSQTTSRKNQSRCRSAWMLLNSQIATFKANETAYRTRPNANNHTRHVRTTRGDPRVQAVALQATTNGREASGDRSRHGWHTKRCARALWAPPALCGLCPLSPQMLRVHFWPASLVGTLKYGG